MPEMHVHAHTPRGDEVDRLVGASTIAAPSSQQPASRAHSQRHTATGTSMAISAPMLARRARERPRLSSISSSLLYGAPRDTLTLTVFQSLGATAGLTSVKDRRRRLRCAGVSGAQNPAAFQTIFGGLYAGGFAALTVAPQRGGRRAVAAIGVDMGKRVGGLLDSSFAERRATPAAPALPPSRRSSRVRWAQRRGYAGGAAPSRKLRRRRPPRLCGGGGRRRCCSASACRRDQGCSRSSTCGRCASRRSASSRRRRSSIMPCRCSARDDEFAPGQGHARARRAGRGGRGRRHRRAGRALPGRRQLVDAAERERHPVPAAAKPALGAARRRERAGGGAPRVQVRPRPAAGDLATEKLGVDAGAYGFTSLQ